MWDLCFQQALLLLFNCADRIFVMVCGIFIVLLYGIFVVVCGIFSCVMGYL